MTSRSCVPGLRLFFLSEQPCLFMCSEWMWSVFRSAHRRHMLKGPTVICWCVCVCAEVVLLWLTAYISWLKCLKETILTSPWTSAASSVYEVVAYNGLLVHICNMNDLKWLINHMSTPTKTISFAVVFKFPHLHVHTSAPQKMFTLSFLFSTS